MLPTTVRIIEEVDEEDTRVREEERGNQDITPINNSRKTKNIWEYQWKSIDYNQRKSSAVKMNNYASTVENRDILPKNVEARETNKALVHPMDLVDMEILRTPEEEEGELVEEGASKDTTMEVAKTLRQLTYEPQRFQETRTTNS